MNKNEFNELLRKAICEYNVSDVKRLLEIGADPNYKLPEEEYKNFDAYEYQPYTPLRLVVFIISDCMIGDQELEQAAKIASLLIKYGAYVKPAIELAESRYGKYNPKIKHTPFSSVLKVIYNAFNK